MAKELNEDTGFNVSIKTLIGIGAAMATIISMWFMLQSDIADAKELPVPADPEVTRMEFDMKDQMIRQTILTTQEDVKEIKKRLLDPDDGVVARININTGFRKSARIWLGVFFTSIIAIVTKMLFK